ncbi:unnamed protein product [marine sediment metagenome]|uniref:Uncharacterized protein n=1 Tax=marine sediment metagenome TaxID=412755 RepID=X0RJA9_9ZZZZ
MGRALYERNGDFSAARDYLLHALDLDIPTKWAVYFRLGAIHQSEGYIDEAIAYYRQALDMSPGNDTVIRRLRALGVTP